MLFNRVVWVVVLLLSLALTATAQDRTIVRAGELVLCTLEEPNLSSATADVGEPVACYVIPFREFGYSVFPRGSFLTGRVSDYREPGRLVGKGWVVLTFDRLIMGTKDEVPISAKVVSLRKYKVDSQGKILGNGHPRRDVFAWSVPIFWPSQLVRLPGRGPRPTLKGETSIVVRMLDDVVVSEAALYPARPSGLSLRK